MVKIVWNFGSESEFPKFQEIVTLNLLKSELFGFEIEIISEIIWNFAFQNSGAKSFEILINKYNPPRMYAI